SHQFLIDELKIPKEKLWVTVYGGDESLEYDQESHDVWLKMGIPEHKIVGIGAPTDPEKRRRKGRGDNFWAAGATGPCGPSSELFIWLGDGEPAEGQNPETDEDNFIEVWNNVFMAYEQIEGGELKPLSQKNVDTGMGLERLTMIIQGKTTVFETDFYDNIIAEIEKLSGKKYPPYAEDTDENNPITRSFRVIADHVRCSIHLIADGVSASNEGRGYVLRRLLRRAVRFGKNLIPSTGSGNNLFLEKIAEVYISEFSEFYPEIGERKKVIIDALQIEESNFLRTLEKGEKKLQEIIIDIKSKNQSDFSGISAFILSDTFGFPKDLTREIVEEKGFVIDEEKFNAEFDAELKKQRERSRASGSFEMKGQNNTVFENLPATKFVGNTGENLQNIDCTVLAFVENEDKSFTIVLDTTPFYAESGGQVGDRGVIGDIKIVDTKKIKGVNGDVFVHYGMVENNNNSSLQVGEILQVSVNQDLRDKTTRHHSAAHLLQSALTFVLGDGIAQAGSLVDENRTRFDFSYPKALKAKEILAVEAKIFEYVNAAHAVTITEMSIDEAKKAGAVALFSEKYGNTVRTVRMGEPSFELCGGTHVQNTAEIGGIKILTEASCSSGIRRIEMVVGDVAQKYFLNKCSVVASVAKTLKSSEVQIEERVAKLIQEKKNMENELSVIAKKLLAFEALEFYDRKIEINGKIVICEPVPTHDLKHVAGMARALSDKAVDSVVLFTEDGGIVIATQKGGVNAREIFEKIKEIAGGNGGGSPFFLQGKGVNLERFPEIRGIVEGSV
ncbi:TPA: alanine--tRNA ligase, partial [Candidatus Peregrinibacteria bacterium]|nr:alanine--tRNA ligase [Candidatus Peregrinibacteria bacterium]